jgi:hypothetical protein
VPSELVVDAFELAREIRELDMRASPYDLSAIGYEPIKIETVEGKRQYAEAQRMFSERSALLRARLTHECDRLLDAPPTRAALVAGIDRYRLGPTKDG